MKEYKKTTLLWNDSKRQREKDYPILLFRSRVIFLHNFILAMFMYFLQVHPYLKRSNIFLGNIIDLLSLLNELYIYVRINQKKTKGKCS